MKFQSIISSDEQWVGENNFLLGGFLSTDIIAPTIEI
jgi:hypothetical protein